jgi:hypothetical protein
MATSLKAARKPYSPDHVVPGLVGVSTSKARPPTGNTAESILLDRGTERLPTEQQQQNKENQIAAEETIVAALPFIRVPEEAEQEPDQQNHIEEDSYRHDSTLQGKILPAALENRGTVRHHGIALAITRNLQAHAAGIAGINVAAFGQGRR